MKIFIYDESRVLIRAVGTPDVMQGENNATLIFMSVAGIDETNFQNYLAQFAATIGTSHPADVITDFGTYVLDGVEYKGWKYFVSSKFTQVAGVLNANLVLSSNGSTLISQTVKLNVNPSAVGQTWKQDINLAQWYQLLAYNIGLKNPKVGVIADSYLDTYNTEGQAGSYFYFGEDGVPHLLFVGYNEDDDLIAQTDYYSDGGAMYCRSRTFSDGEWTNWVINSQASAISFNVTGLPQLTGANTVQKAIAALAHAVYPIAFVTSLAPSPFTSVDVPNSKDKIIKDDLGQDLNVGGVLDYAFAIFGRYNTHAFDFDNTLIMTSDGAIYRMKYENGSMVAHWFNGSPAQVKLEQSAVNQSLSEGISANNVLIKNNVVGNTSLTMDPSTYVITITNTNLNGQVLSTYSVDIPAEMAMVNASYDNTTKDLTFTLQNGNTVVVPLDDIISGLASQDWVNTAIANALLPYATTSWVDSNYMSLTKGGMVDLAEDPASANTNYFGASHGTKSFHKISDNSYAYRVSDGDGNLVQHNANKNGVVSWLKTANGVSTITKVPFKSTAGTHDLAFQEDLDDANAKITASEAKIAKNESDIQYLYRQVIGGGDLVTATDSSVSLTSQPFPLTVSPKALLDYVGGMCQKVNQLVENGDMSNSAGWSAYYYGGTVTFSDGVATVTRTNGTCDISRTLNNTIPSGHTVLFASRLKTANSNNVVFGHDNQAVSQIASTTTFSTVCAIKTLEIDMSRIYVACVGPGASTRMDIDWYAIADLTAIYGAGNEPTSTSDARIQWLMSYLASHPEYDAGSIITAPVTKVVSKGFNLWDEEWEVGSIGITGENSPSNSNIRSKNYISVLPNTDYYMQFGATTGYVVYFYDKANNFIGYVDKGGGHSFTTPLNCYRLRFQMYSSYGTTYNHDICINVSNASMNGTYMPYRAPIEHPVPAEVRALEGYGLGYSATLFNKTNLENKVFGKVVREIDLADISFSYFSQIGSWTGAMPSDMKQISSGTKPNMLSEKYDTIAYNSSTMSSSVGCISQTAGGNIVVNNGSDETRPSGKVIIELTAPTETDISEYIDSDVIVVSAGGHLKFENENDLGVPYSATYQCEPETQGEGE